LSNIVVTGSGDGLGRQICEQLALVGHSVIGLTLTSREKATTFTECTGVDVSDGDDAWDASRDCFANWENNRVDVLINCAGVNQIGYLEDFSVEKWDYVLDVNTRAIFLMCKAFLSRLSCRNPDGTYKAGAHAEGREVGGTILNIISNASHIPMTGSAAYNASKGAAHILTLQLARELTRRHGITVFGISPNKLKGTGMSTDIERQVCETRGWTPEYARQYQLDALLSGEETDPEQLAKFISYLLQSKDHHKYFTGCVIPYGA